MSSSVVLLKLSLCVNLIVDADARGFLSPHLHFVRLFNIIFYSAVLRRLSLSFLFTYVININYKEVLFYLVCYPRRQSWSSWV